MPITRSVWLDDDGSGTTGTILNNSELQKIYDNVDALDAAEAAAQGWIDVPFAAGNFTGVGGTWTVAAGHVLAFAYRRDRNVLLVHLYIQGSTVAGAPTQLVVTIPAGVAWRHWSNTPVTFALGATTAQGFGQGAPGAGTVAFLQSFLAPAFPAGTVHLGATLALPIA